MKYFFLAYLAVILLVVGAFGFRGDKFSSPPFELLPDMDHQDKVQFQEPSGFFADGMAARKPVPGTVPRGLGESILPLEFTDGQDGYYATGTLDGKFGNGMPEELGASDEATAKSLLNRGQDMYGVHCAICHGDSGDGKGVVGKYFADANVVVANLNNFKQETHPDGYIFEVISNGKGRMGAYKHNIPLRDRWAIVAYLRALQAAQ